ncbi:hypothetical protein [Gloeobacter morelensis]|uniref:DUF3618 domain-containing protein n=1 Tax=Gloeobacter morelensis MG652769 TaxID=2781736 RepID=A0ABY3PPH1_9CYAN|nr:hypothetical protein [Gloeobacter morelensis]UFP95444.1 hypothetical protein ISF26_04120 [Gloeobacter morelensis MG652769]
MADSQEVTVAANGKLAPSGPPETAPLAEADLQRTRERIAQTASAIEQRVKADLDWRTWVNRYPLGAVGVAAAAGALVALSLPGGSRRRANRDAVIAREVGKSSLVASVVSTVATIALREGARIVVERFLGDGKKPE